MRIQVSEEKPKEFMSLIIDGMNSCYISMKIPKSKGILIVIKIIYLYLATNRIERLKLHIHGLIDHGAKKRILYGSYDHWEYGPNYICSILYNYLTTKKKIFLIMNGHTFFIYK